MDKEIKNLIRSDTGISVYLEPDHRMFIVSDSLAVSNRFGHANRYFWVTNKPNLNADDLYHSYENGDAIVKIFEKTAHKVFYKNVSIIKYGKYE